MGSFMLRGLWYMSRMAFFLETNHVCTCHRSQVAQVFGSCSNLKQSTQRVTLRDTWRVTILNFYFAWHPKKDPHK